VKNISIKLYIVMSGATPDWWLRVALNQTLDRLL